MCMLTVYRVCWKPHAAMEDAASSSKLDEVPAPFIVRTEISDTPIPIEVVQTSSHSEGIMVQSHTAGVDATQFSGCSSKHLGLGSVHLSGRSLLGASTTHASALVPGMDGQRPILRADPLGLHAGKYQPDLVEEPKDSQHFMATWSVHVWEQATAFFFPFLIGDDNWPLYIRYTCSSELIPDPLG